MNTNEAWAAKLRARNIGDFRNWKDHDAYKQSLSRVLRDLTKPQAPASTACSRSSALVGPARPVDRLRGPP